MFQEESSSWLQQAPDPCFPRAWGFECVRVPCQNPVILLWEVVGSARKSESLGTYVMLNLVHISEVFGPKRQTPKYFFSGCCFLLECSTVSQFFILVHFLLYALPGQARKSGLQNCASNYGVQTGLFPVFSVWISILGEKESEFTLSTHLAATYQSLQIISGGLWPEQTITKMLFLVWSDMIKTKLYFSETVQNCYFSCCFSS